MNNIIELSNVIKYDSYKCTQCLKCVNECQNKSLYFDRKGIVLKLDSCIACKKCIEICNTHALFYNINDGIIEGSNTIAILPYDADFKFLNKKYNSVLTYELGEKVKIIETAFEMVKRTSLKLNNEVNRPLIISDILNINLILKSNYPSLEQYLSKVKNIFYISSYLCRLQNKNNNLKIVSYAIPFEVKHYFEDINIIDEICDIPFKYKYKYNILDILNTYINLCELKTNLNLNIVDISKNKIINFSNNSLNIKVLLINNLSELELINIFEYDFIFVCKELSYTLNEQILKDKEVNILYKTKLKAPGKTSSLYIK